MKGTYLPTSPPPPTTHTNANVACPIRVRFRMPCPADHRPQPPPTSSELHLERYLTRLDELIPGIRQQTQHNDKEGPSANPMTFYPQETSNFAYLRQLPKLKEHPLGLEVHGLEEHLLGLELHLPELEVCELEDHLPGLEAH
ncbi:hypothetical protein DITRI_Ditri08aG0034400 [Diplodiscus trichospermus]